MSSLAEIERAAGTLPRHEMERLFVFLAGQLGWNELSGEFSRSTGPHGVLDIPSVRLGQMLPPSDKDDLLEEMLEGRL